MLRRLISTTIKNPLNKQIRKSPRYYGISSSTFFEDTCKNKIVNGINKLEEYNHIWLRENCRCNLCFNHTTQQRNVLFHQFKKEIQPYRVSEHDGKLCVTWRDGHKSEYTVEWLMSNSYPGPKTNVDKILWDSNSMKSGVVEPVDYSQYLESDDGLRNLLKNILVYGYGLVSGVPPNLQTTESVCSRVSFILETIFGGMWEFTADGSRGDTAYSNIALGAHTDLTYLQNPAGIQVFHCVSHIGEGGQTLLVDGFHCLEQLRKAHPESFQLLSSTPIYHEYKEPGVHTRSLDTVIKTHPATGELLQLRYNPYDRSPISTVPQKELPKYYQALKHLGNIIDRAEQIFWIKLQPGTVIFIDNWRVMHGRSGFTGRRQMCGCYLPRDDWLSKARTLGFHI